MEENFSLDLVSALDQGRSQKQVNADIKTLEKTINMLQLTATLAKGNSKKEINAYINTLSDQLSTIKLKAKIDSKNLKSEINSALSKVSFKDIDVLNIDENKTKLKAQKVIADAKAYAEKNPINIGINYENRRNKLDNDLTAYLNRHTKISESSVLLKEADKVRNLIGAINDKKSLREATDAFQLYKSEVSATGFASKSTADRIKSMFGHITKLGGLFSVTSLAVNNFTKSLGTLKDIDDILTEISKTSDLTAQKLEELGNASFKSASKYGKTASDYLTGIQEMSRSGFYGDKGTAMAEQSLLAQAAGDMSADVANKYILATNAAYKYNGEATKLNAVLDGQNSITNRNSVALSDMAIAMSEAGTVASSYRVSIEDLSAMIGTMEAVTKLGGSEVGNGIKAILINLQNVTSSKITDTLDAANASMTEFVNGTEKLRDPISILRDLAETFNKLDEDDALRAEILTNIGGKHQAAKLAALLQNMELFDKQLVDYSEGSGSALEEAMKSANNLSGKLNQLQNSWDSLVNSIVNKNSVLNGLTFGDKLIQGVESFIDTFGEIPVLLTTINTAMAAMKKDYGITQLVNPETKRLDVQGNLMGIDFSAIKEQKNHFSEVKEAIQLWNDAMSNGEDSLKSFSSNIVQNNAQLKTYLSTCSKDAPASLAGYKASLNAAGVSTDTLRLKTILLNSAISMVIGVAIQGIVKALDNYIHRVEKARERTDELFDEFKQMNDTLANHKKTVSELADRYDELSKGVNLSTNDNVSLSTEEYEEFLDINEQMAQSFPELAKGIDENGNSILTLGTKGITAKEQLEELLQTEEDLNNFRIAQGLEEAFKGVYTYVEDANEATEKLNGTISDSNEAMSKLQDIAENGIKLTGENGQLIFAGNINNQAELDYMNSLTQSVNEFWKSLDGNRRVELDINPSDLFTQNMDEYSGVFEIYANLYQLTPEEITALENIIQDNVGDASGALLDSISDQSQELQEQINKGENAWRDFIPNLVSGMKSKQTFKDLDSDLQDIAVQIVEGLDYSYASAMKEYDPDPYAYIRDKFIVPMGNLNDSDKQKLQSSFEELLKLDADNLSKSNQAEIEKFITTIATLLGKDPLEIRVALGFDIEDTQNRYNEVLKRSKRQLNGYGHDDRGFETNNTVGDKLDDFWNENVVTEDDLVLWQNVTAGINDATKAMNAYTEAKKNTNTVDIDKTPVSFDQAWADSFTSENDKVRELGNTLLGLAEKGRLTKETFNEADSTVDGYFKNLSVSADEAVAKINKLVDESEQLSSMSSQISSMAEALGTKQENGFVEADTLSGFDVEVRGLDSWDRFQEVLGSTTSSYEECQEAANALATEWVNSSDFLAQLTEQNEEYYKTQLESMGIENYEELISYAHALNEAKEVLSQSSLELGNATYDEIEALIEEGTYSELTANMILALYDAKIAEQAVTIDTAADCENLIALAGDTDRTSQSIQLLIQLMNIYNSLESGVYDNNVVARAGALATATAIKSQLEALANGEVKGMEIEPTVKLGSKGKSSAKSAGKDAGKSYKDGLKEELNDLNSVISGITGRIDDQISVIRSQKEAALESIDAQIDALNEQKSALEAQKKALEEARDAAVEALEEERDARIEVIEQQQKQLELAIKSIDKQIKQKEKVIKSINDEIKAMQDANAEKRRQIDLQKAMYELERLQHQRTILQYSEGMGMHYVTDSKNIRDQKDKVDDAKLEIEIANKQKQIDLIEKEIDLLNEKKEAINEQIDLLDEEIERINEYYDKEIEKVEKFYDEQIKAIDAQIESIDRQIEALQKQREQTEKYYESLIEGLEKSKSKYEELTEIVEKAELSAKLKQLGIDEEALLNGSEEEFQKLKNAYMDVVMQLNSGNDEVLSALQELSGYNGTAPAMLEDSNGKLDEMNSKLDTSNQNVGNVNSSLGETATTTSNVTSNVADLNANLSETNTIITAEQTVFDALRQKIDEVITAINEKITATQTAQATTAVATTAEMACYMLLKEKILEVKESLDAISNTVTTLDATPVNNLTTAFQLLYNQLLLVSTTLGAGMEGAEEGAVGGIASAIQALNEISLEDGIIAQFTNLKIAVDEVTAAIGGGGGGDSESSSGGEGSGGSGGSGKGGESGGKGSEGEGGGGGSLTDAITQMGETAAEVIGEPDAEGDGTVIGEFGALETAVNDVTAAIGSGESEGGEGSGEGEDGNLIGSIIDLGDTTEEELGESGGDGIIGRFEEFRDVIEDAAKQVASISDGLDEIDGKEVECTITINIKVNGDIPAFASGTVLGNMQIESATYNAKYGKAFANGTIGLPKAEKNALVSEYGQTEMTVLPDGKTIVTDTPTMMNLPKDTVIYNEEQTKKILSNKIDVNGTAHADGTTDDEGWFTAADGTKLRPHRPGDRSYDLCQKIDAYLDSIDNNLDILTVNARARYEKDMTELERHVTNNVNNVTNNRNVQPVINGGINITCPGVTSKEVAQQVGVEVGRIFNGMHLDAEQRSRMR